MSAAKVSIISLVLSFNRDIGAGSYLKDIRGTLIFVQRRVKSLGLAFP